jgi:hypothetical protein
MFNAIAVMSESDILAIHGVVSNELKAQIEQAYPHLFKQQFDFSDWDNRFSPNANLPFVVGKGLVEQKDKYKSLIVKGNYKTEVHQTYSGLDVIRFIER